MARAVRSLSRSMDDRIAAAADPTGARRALIRLTTAHPGLDDRITADPDLAAGLVAVTAASPHLTQVLEADRGALDVLARPDQRPPLDAGSPDALAAWRDRELLRIAALDLLGRASFEQTVAAVSSMAADVVAVAVELADAANLAVIGMGKLGGRELNYSSDVDVMLVAPDGHPAHQRTARRAVAIAGRVVRLDTTLRPEGRDGSVVRSVQAYRAHWDRWAQPWEFQALLKARPVAGDADVGREFAAAAAERLWNRPFGAEDLRSLRAMKRRAETDAARRTTSLEIKRSPGGIRDIEFSAQLLQLVHGQHDPDLRVRGTLPALTELAAGGYIDADDGDWLARSYRHLRRIEHMLQLVDDRQVHELPNGRAARRRLARVLGYRDRPRRAAVDELDAELAACRTIVRQIHERLYFRPLLEAFAGVPGPVATGAGAGASQLATTRLAAFGFSDAERTRQAVVELTRGLTRSSKLMQQLLPLLLDWLSTSPDPDTGLLGLRRLASGPTRTMELASAFRDSPETARRLCVMLGTSRRLGDLLVHHPDLIDEIGRSDALQLRSGAELAEQAGAAMATRAKPADRRSALGRIVDREWLRIAAHDVLGLADTRTVSRALTNLAEGALDAALRAVVSSTSPSSGVAPVAVIALGRFGGQELSYASDLDLVLVHGGHGHAQWEATERAAAELLRFLRAGTDLLATLDLGLRPEGRPGPLVNSVDSYVSYFEHRALMWERQAWVRARPVAGDLVLGERLLTTLDPIVWRRLEEEDRRDVRRMKARIEAERIPAGEDPAFHLKLGPGALADVEFCAQLLQLDAGVRAQGTLDAVTKLAAGGHLDDEEAVILSEAYRFCERTRDRWFLVRGARADALPQGDDLARLARSLQTSPQELRDDYRRVTRRARRVVNRRFYGVD